VALEIIHRPAARPNDQPPLLFVHGAWHGAWCWDRGFMEYVAERGFDCYAVSLRGHAGSPIEGSLRWTRWRHFVDDLSQAVDSLPATPVLVGHSMGGYLVQKYLETHDAPAAVLLATVPKSGTAPATFRFARRHPLEFMRLLATVDLWPLVRLPKTAKDMLLPDDMPEGEVLEIHSQLQSESFMTYLDMQLFALPKPSKVASPVRVIAAGRDRVFSLGEEKATAAAYGFEPVIFDDRAHDLMFGSGWESVAEAVISEARSAMGAS